jgi:hypothetical protein
MKIALDYDETFTAAPMLWKQFITLCKQYGHEIKFVTYRDSRYHNDDICADAYDCGIDIVFTAGKQKQHICPDIDIWIDDSPETVVSYGAMVDMCNGCEINNDLGEQQCL